MADASLLLLLDEVRNKTLRLLDGVTEPQARFTPPGLANSILWHAGHALVVTDALCLPPRLRRLPDGYAELFSWKSTPAETPADRWPPLAEVVEALKEQHPRLRAAIASLTDHDLDGPANEWQRPDRKPRYLILHGLHDEANHGGEIWLLRKLQR